MNTPEEQADVHQGGIKVYNFCEDMMEAIVSAFSTYMFVLFPSKKDPPVD